MFFSSPIWLVALPPWVALTVWMLWGRRRRIEVPFLRLWQGPITGPKAKRSIQLPPIAVALALSALLLALLAASRPIISGRLAGKAGITLIVDHGFTMSPRGRLPEAIQATKDGIAAQLPDSSIRLITVPQIERPVELTASECFERLAKLTPAAVDTRQSLIGLVREQLASTSGPLIVISDQQLGVLDERLIQISPRQAVQNVGITGMSARQQPRPQVMVQVRNQSDLHSAQLSVASGAQRAVVAIDLPFRGAQRNYFVDLPAFGSSIEAQLDVADELDADNRAWLVREGSSPRIQARADLPEELRRLIGAYQQSRAPSNDAPVVAVLGSDSQLSPDAPAVVLARADQPVAAVNLEEIQHPLTRQVDWRELNGPLRIAEPAPSGWTPIVSSNGRPLVAVRSGPQRQVWVGFESDRWVTTTSCVIFWTNVFDWLGGGAEHFASHPLGEWSAQWKPLQISSAVVFPSPGIYHRSDGAVRAFSAPNVPIPDPPGSADWRARLRKLALTTGGQELAGWLIGAALLCLVVACATLRRAAGLRSVPLVLDTPPRLVSYNR